MKSVTLHSPATIANLVCGFDIIGLCLKEPYDIMTLEWSDQPGLTIEHIDGYGLPILPEENVAGGALLALMRELEPEIGMRLIIDKKIMPGSGLGSSAASATGAVLAANRLLQHRFTNEELLQFAMCGEKIASGVKHADNLAPCLMGGVTLIRSIHPLDVIDIPSPELFISVVHPQIEVKTSDARRILKKEVPLRSAIKQWGNIGGLIAGLMKGDHDLIGRSLEDVIIEPIRNILIPGFEEVKSRSLAAGALGGGIAGSGPSVFMLSKNHDTAVAVESEMKAIYSRMGLDAKTYVTSLNSEGIHITHEAA
ncbi:MAG: homoserine kinase [Bacteroidetes bacterium]|nr:homoserine kinase [Bacteroidota bacterium]